MSVTVKLSKMGHGKIISSNNNLKLLREAWEEKNSTKFHNCLSENLDTVQINEIIRDIILTNDDQYDSARFTFAKIMFENHLHRKAFLEDKPLIFHLIEVGQSKIFELLLQYTPNLRKTSDGGNSVLHVLCNRMWTKRKESYKKCMELLLDHGEIDVNALNNEYRTALDLAITSKNSDAVEMILNSTKRIYLDRRYHDRPTARQEIFNFFPSLRETLAGKYVSDERVTFSELHAWLRNERLEKKGKFLQRFPKAMQDTSLIDELTSKLTIFLQEACENNLIDEVKLLINYGADPSVEDKWNDSRSAINVAVENGHVQILALLLERASAVNHTLENSRRNKDNVNVKDEYGNTALHYAVRYGNDKTTLEILKLGGYLGSENFKNETPLTTINHQVFEKFLNSQIKRVKHGPTTQHHIQIPIESKPVIKKFVNHREKFIFDCRFLTQPQKSTKNTTINTSPDMKLLKQMTELKELRPLLTHPVLRSFTLLKWEKLKHVFYINLLLHVILNIILTYNILVPITRNQEIDSVLRSIQSALIILLLLQEILQLLIRGTNYITQFENYLEIIIISLGGYLCIEGITNMNIFRHIAAFLLITSWLHFLLFIGKHPIFSIQVEIFRMVIYSFIKFLSVYLILIIAFAFAFFILFNECSGTCPAEFKNIPLSIFKTFVLVSGEFDLTDMSFKNYPGTSHVIFLLFLFLIAIVLLNLLNGLAVYDTKKIKEDALLHSYVSRVKYLASLEELMYGVRHWSVFKIITDYFLKFDCEIVDSEKKLYELDRDILKVARGIVISYAEKKDSVDEKPPGSEMNGELLTKMWRDLSFKIEELDRKLTSLNNVSLSESTL